MKLMIGVICWRFDSRTNNPFVSIHTHSAHSCEYMRGQQTRYALARLVSQYRWQQMIQMTIQQWKCFEIVIKLFYVCQSYQASVLKSRLIHLYWKSWIEESKLTVLIVFVLEVTNVYGVALRACIVNLVFMAQTGISWVANLTISAVRAFK